MSHTKCPWWEGKDEDGGLVYGTEHDPDAGVESAVVVADTSRQDGDAISEQANAAFIVRACNAHDELLAACEVAKQILATHIPPDAFDGHAARALVIVKDAIAKAKPEGQR